MAPTIGVTSVIAPSAFVLSVVVWLIVFSFTNYVSLASLALAVALPISAVILDKPFSVVLFSVAVCLLTAYKHNENISRLLRGEEKKTVIFSKKS